MSQNMKKKTITGVNKEFNQEDLSKPWVQKRKGFIIITTLSILLMAFVAIQLIMQNPQEWLKAIGWVFLFGGSIWLVFFGFNWFHSLFRNKPADKNKQ